MSDNIKGLRNELKMKIEECNFLHDELKLRPFKVTNKCTLHAYPRNIEASVKDITDKINGRSVFYVVANYKDLYYLKIQPLAHADQIFYGLVQRVTIKLELQGTQQAECDVKVNDFVEFQTCDLYQD